MLVLSRKAKECVVIGSTIQVRVLETHRDRVKLGFTGPSDVPIHREEVYLRILASEEEPADVHVH